MNIICIERALMVPRSHNRKHFGSVGAFQMFAKQQRIGACWRATTEDYVREVPYLHNYAPFRSCWGPVTAPPTIHGRRRGSRLGLLFIHSEETSPQDISSILPYFLNIPTPQILHNLSKIRDRDQKSWDRIFNENLSANAIGDITVQCCEKKTI